MCKRRQWMKTLLRGKASASKTGGCAQVPMKRGRAVYIDILRILACYLVIFNHTGWRGFYLFASYPVGSLHWIVSFFFSTFCKTVPLFFMISGGLLLGKEESIGKTLRRAVKIVIDILLFSIFYYWLESRLKGASFSLTSTLKSIVKSNYWHMWYLYAYFTFILTVPILRKFVLSLDQKTSKYMLILAFFYLGIIPIIEYFWTGDIYANLKPAWLTANIFIFPVTGYIIENKIEITKRTLYQCWSLVFLCFILSSVCESYLLIKEPGSLVEKFNYNFTILNNASIYITVKYIFENKKFGDRTYKILTEIGACTYGIYLIHICFLGRLPNAPNPWAAIESLGYFGVFITCGCVFILAGVLTWLLRRIPIVRKLF